MSDVIYENDDLLVSPGLINIKRGQNRGIIISSKISEARIVTKPMSFNFRYIARSLASMPSMSNVLKATAIYLLYIIIFLFRDNVSSFFCGGYHSRLDASQYLGCATVYGTPERIFTWVVIIAVAHTFIKFSNCINRRLLVFVLILTGWWCTISDLYDNAAFVGLYLNMSKSLHEFMYEGGHYHYQMIYQNTLYVGLIIIGVCGYFTLRRYGTFVEITTDAGRRIAITGVHHDQVSIESIYGHIITSMKANT